MTDELVLVVPRILAVGADAWHGVRSGGVAERIAAIEAAGEFRPRAEMERDPSWKQVIPYLVLRDGDRTFLMRRTRAGGDARLHDLWSVGVGGHVNPGDGGIAGGLAREWAEEIVADFVPAFRPVGVLNDDTTDVGSVHLGIVCVADAGGRPAAVRETHKLVGAFASPAEVRAVRDAMESWSGLVVDFLDGDGSVETDRT
jgi:predicted NUDIX family phosphoesterase